MISKIAKHAEFFRIGINLIQTIRRKSDNRYVSKLFYPVPVKPESDDSNAGADLTTNLKTNDILKIINSFYHKKEMKTLCIENGLDNYLMTEAVNSFRQYCMQTKNLPVDLHIIFSDVISGVGHVTDLFPYFMQHAKLVFPHLEYLDDLKKISDLRTPASWYPEARSISRKIIYHAGPTNSGKTYHALQRFMNAKSGVYCGPLKLLAVEVFNKCNSSGTPCDLITGEERKSSDIKGDKPVQHISSTAEMINLKNHWEVAVIDEIQLLQDQKRGWAWTRALLGVPATEVHLCGEEGAINLVESLCNTMGEEVEIRKYQRLTELKIEDEALMSLKNIQPGDCIVCFNKNDIFNVRKQLEQYNFEVAVIYGSLPPSTKLIQAANFNDPNHPCNVLIATDAIGMGLNLHIRRIIFYSIMKPDLNKKGEKEMKTISVSSALQIAGRAGRYQSQYEIGYVTTFKHEELNILKDLLSKTPDNAVQAGLHPTIDQIELYAYYLPNSPLSNLIDIFVSLCTVDDSMYFMCNIDDFKFLADMIEHIPLSLRSRFIFCCAPINRKLPYVCSVFVKFVRQCSNSAPITYKWLHLQIGWPMKSPRTIIDLIHLEAVFDVLDLYLWLSYRFIDLFPDRELVQMMQKELDEIIQKGLQELLTLVKNSESASISVDTLIDGHQTLKPQDDNLQSDSENNSKSNTQYEGRLTDILLSQGLLTPQMIKKLQAEWTENKNKFRKNPHFIRKLRKP